MKKYIGIKFVYAEPMTANEATDKGYCVEKNNGDGYEVTYEDGYKSWCPKHVFDKANAEVHNEELASTARMMVSDDYKERFRAEYTQLKNRLNGLMAMVERWDNETLPFIPTCPRATYDFQICYMSKYLKILEIRAKIENVEL